MIFRKESTVPLSTDGLRDDVASAIRSAPPKEMKQLGRGEEQIRYLSDSLPEQEQIIAIASCYGTGDNGGIMALTDRRAILVFGERARNGYVGQQVHTFKFGEITDFSFNKSGVRGVQSCPTVIDVNPNGRVTLMVGMDQEWALAFLNRVQQQLNRFRLS